MKTTTLFSQLSHDELAHFNVSSAVNFNRHQLLRSTDECLRVLNPLELNQLNNIIESALLDIDKLLEHENETKDNTSEDA